MVRANIRRNSASPPPLSLGPLPPTPAHDAQTTVSPTQLKREPTPFDELPMSHLISFPIIDSPTSADSVDTNNPFDAFHALQNPYSSYSSASASAALLRDAFDYYRLPNPPPLSDINMSFQGPALKPQLHSQTLPDLTDALAFSPSSQQQCIPTSHLFPSAPVPQQSKLSHSPPPLDDDESPPPTSSPTLSHAQPSKKRPPRAAISTKDFVPPDVSGLSKREARLVKNRAAAFLSRQRKREEFEGMEVRVAQLEQENARLLALTRSQSHESSPAPSAPKPKIEPTDDTELASLRSLLAQARSRAEHLESELARLRSTSASASTSSSSDAGSDADASSPGSLMQVKREADAPLPKRAGLFGVVLLCALPSLLSLPASTAPHAASRFSFTPGPVLDWPGMDVDVDSGGRAHLPLSFLNGPNPDPAPHPHDLFTAASAETEAEFDVSFTPAALPGKIRVRIESPAAASSSDAWELDFAQERRGQEAMLWDSPNTNAGANVDMAVFASGSGRRRVRIALKSGPMAGAEGGEWEVEVR